MNMLRLILNRVWVSAFGVVVIGSASAQGFTATVNHLSYHVDSIYTDGCSGCSSFYRFWLNPYDPTEDVTISCSWGIDPGNPHKYVFDHTIVSYLQSTRTETWANYEHVLRANSGHVSGTLRLSVNGVGWGGYSLDFLGDGVDIQHWSDGDDDMPVIFGQHGIVNNIGFYYDESAWSANSLEFDPTPSDVLSSEGVECGSSLSAIVDEYYGVVHVACQGLPNGVNGAIVIGLNALSLPIPYSTCALGTDILDVIPTTTVPGRGMATLEVTLPRTPVTFRMQHLHFDQSAPGAPFAFFASNTLRVAMP